MHHVAIAIDPGDVEAMRDRLVANRVDFNFIAHNVVGRSGTRIEDIGEDTYAASFYFSDPDGLIIEFCAWLPAWERVANGTSRLPVASRYRSDTANRNTPSSIAFRRTPVATASKFAVTTELKWQVCTGLGSVVARPNACRCKLATTHAPPVQTCHFARTAGAICPQRTQGPWELAPVGPYRATIPSPRPRRAPSPRRPE